MHIHWYRMVRDMTNISHSLLSNSVSYLPAKINLLLLCKVCEHVCSLIGWIGLTLKGECSIMA